MSETTESSPRRGEVGHLKRGLKRRHLSMIAIGGSIGTGLFVASGATISQAGPGGALAAYALIGLMVFLLMQSLGEMATYIPVAGSFGDYGTRFVSPSFGFAMGWNYWYNWSITVSAELVAAALVMRYWVPAETVPAWAWSVGFMAILFLLNYFSAKGYGEAEFWFAGIKVVTVLVFLFLGVLMIFGVMGGGSPGFANWTIAGEGGQHAPFVNGILGMLAVFMVAGFSFQGTELVGVAAGEAEEPEENLPRAVRTIFWRILLFYIGAILVIGFLIPFTDPNLLNSSEENIAISPFALVFDKAGIAFAAAVMNAVILTSVLSAGNSGLFASTRMLYALAVNGQAPRIFATTNRRGVPVAALIATSAVGFAGFIAYLISEDAAYTWLLNASGLAGFITWVGIAWCHIKFRQALRAQGRQLSDLPFRALFYPAGPIIALVMCVLVIAGQSFESIVAGSVTFTSLLSSYIGIPLFIALWAGHKLTTKAAPIDPAQADLSRPQD